MIEWIDLVEIWTCTCMWSPWIAWLFSLLIFRSWESLFFCFCNLVYIVCYFRRSFDSVTHLQNIWTPCKLYDFMVYMCVCVWYKLDKQLFIMWKKRVVVNTFGVPHGFILVLMLFQYFSVTCHVWHKILVAQKMLHVCRACYVHC